MSFLSGFKKREIQGKLELEIVVSKLQLLASYIEEGTDKPSDLKHWQESMVSLLSIELKSVPYLSFIKDAYSSLYKFYLRKNHPELTE